MARKRRSFSPPLKAKVALEAIRGVKTIAEIAQKSIVIVQRYRQ